MPLPTVLIRQADTKLVCSTASFSTTVTQLLRGVPSSKWNQKTKLWEVEERFLPELLKTLAGVPHKLEVQSSFTFLPRAESVPVQDSADWEALRYTPKTVPYEHQKTGVVLGAKKRTFAFVMEMGTGKTKTVIDLLSLLIQRDDLDGAIVVGPKAVLFNWQNEFETHSPLPSGKRQCVVATGTGPQKRAALELHAAFYVTNYETLLTHESELHRILAQRRFALVLDESTRIKSHKAKQTKAAHRLGMLAQARYIMTGTPITQGPLDAFGQFTFLDSKILGHHNYYSFRSEYGILGGFQGKEVLGYKNLDRLSQRIAPWSYRVLKKDCLDLPEKTYRVVDLPMGPTQAKAYRSMKEDALVELGGQTMTAPVVLTKLVRLQQITSGFMPIIDERGEQTSLHTFDDAPKLEALEELVQEAVDGGQKVLVWCRFIWEVEQLWARLAKVGAVTYFGGLSAQQRQANVDAFQKDPACRVFIGQIQTGGMGITLTAGSVCIYYSNSFSLSDRLQSEDRAHRIGQRNPVTYIDLVCKGTVDRYILKTLKDKKNIADVVNGDSIREMLGDA